MAFSFDSNAGALRARYTSKPGLLHYLIFSPTVEITVMYMYYFRDCFAGFIRYALQIVGANSLWFLPDVLAFLCVGIFVARYAIVAKNIVAILLLIWVLISAVIAYIFFKDFIVVASGVKMLAPVFVGFCFCMRPLNEMRSIRYLFYIVFAFSCIGILWNSFGPLAWEGFAYEGLGGGERTAGKQWWVLGGTARLGGFAADSTMASFFVMAGFIVVAVNFKLAVRLTAGAIALYITYLSTSKTSLMVIGFIAALLAFGWLLGDRRESNLLRTVARYSYISIFIPFLLIVLLNGVNLADISLTLYSMQDRINNSWVLPVVYMADLFPPGFVTGCGLGCFNYPMQLFPTDVQQYSVPVDNFYYGTYLMFGIPFLLFLLRHFRTQKPTDPIIVISTIAMNFFGVTILCYGPASSLLLFGIIYSGNFSSKAWGKYIDEYHAKPYHVEKPGYQQVRPRVE
ncbi:MULTISPECIES: hypothetical protein [unclassified Rhizobium]|uniref:hypothetical protein n=1 Tax=unclassified Rhizobium TaxID=2613769 RepID=UPI001160D213|nr:MULTISPECIES: hypothetical protein [unclassified Rhizobium]TQX85325.1 hypothetical protein EQW76_21515 [Rhizobium sp. rho-13.1]TQY09870.1 hypothetical protein EQW74_21280 [Rhizobium sp. rho-1.1]